MMRSAAGERLADILPKEAEVEGPLHPGARVCRRPEELFPLARQADGVSATGGQRIRVETGYAEGRDVTPHYDPMIAKVIVKAATRERRSTAGRRAAAFDIQGLKHNIPAVVNILNSDAFREGRRAYRHRVEVLAGPRKYD
jgi:acetyl-CoA carboxylase, biotin carboxylase subunit